MQPEPWDRLSSDINVGNVMKGSITKLASFGAFARVKGGLEGLIHLSELSYDKIEHPGEIVKEGQEVDVKIIRIEDERKRLGLSLLLDKNLESEEKPKDNNVDVESKEDGDQEPSSEESEEKPKDNNVDVESKEDGDQEPSSEESEDK